MPNILGTFRAGLHPGRTAFLRPDGGTVTYGAFDGWISTVAHAVAAWQPAPGQRVAVVMPRDPVGLALFLGVVAKDICCPIAPGMRREELEQFLATAEIGLLLAPASDATARAAAAAQGVAFLGVAQGAGGAPQFDASPSSAGPVSAAATEADPYALLMQTSGTTDAPKSVLLRHGQVLTTATGIVDAFALGPDDTCLNPMPLSHGHGLITAGLTSLLAGSRAICLPGFSARLFAETLEQYRPTWFTGSPAMHIALLDHYKLLRRKPENLALRFFRSSSAPLPSTIIGALEALFDAPLIETYGLTETATVIVANPLPPGRRKIGSIGLPCCGAELRIVDDVDADVGPGQEGEILVRGPSVIRHYGARPPPVPDTANFLDGWLRTGDIGYRDDDGYVFICGRSKELIKRGGLSVYPNEIDAALLECSGVADAGTFAIAHRSLGEDVVCAVVMRDGVRFDEDALRAVLLQRLSSYKVPSAIVAVDAIWKSETGKIARRNMGRWFAATLAPGSQAAANPTEARLLATWRGLLGRTDIGVTDNLFLFGADPMIADRFRAEFDMPTERGFAFRHPTIRRQAEQLASTVG